MILASAIDAIQPLIDLLMFRRLLDLAEFGHSQTWQTLK